MNPLGLVSVPRPDFPRQAGSLFSATVDSRVGTYTWKIRLGGSDLLVTTQLELEPGQRLRLKLISKDSSQFVFQFLGEPPGQQKEKGPPDSALSLAFFSRGLAIINQKLVSWQKWLVNVGTSDKEGWAASLEARGASPSDLLTAGLHPWLSWQEALEAGRQDAPPENEEFWDLWNSKRESGQAPWLAQLLHWEYEGRQESGLLQAHFNPQRQMIDQWNLTAAPQNVGFRLAAICHPDSLDLTWYFFSESDRSQWVARIPVLEESFSTPEFKVSLRVAGRPQLFAPLKHRGIDVEA